MTTSRSDGDPAVFAVFTITVRVKSPVAEIFDSRMDGSVAIVTVVAARVVAVRIRVVEIECRIGVVAITLT